MGRPRKSGNKDLPTGLYRDPDTGMFFIKRKGKRATLETKNKQMALTLYANIRSQWEEDDLNLQAEKIAARVKRITAPAGAETFAIYATNWRELVLPTLPKKNGSQLADKTRNSYASIVKNEIEPSNIFSITLPEITATILRKFLSEWLDKPHYYNYIRATLSRILTRAVEDGLIDRNPAVDVVKRPTENRKVYIEDGDYVAITELLTEEWHRRVCDLIYLLSHRPGDILRLRESDIKGNEIHFTAKKNNQPMIIEMNTDLADALNWFKQWKREQGLHSPLLICHPLKSRRNLIAKPVSVEFISRRFHTAVIAAGFENGSYQLLDIRPKGLSDEFVVAGDSDKGGHKTQQMKEHYRRIKLPMRAVSHIKKIS